ncbi:MAG: outer membrane beta-barrel protein [Candidatus Neomarinimicrobiota bacterium]|nr:outer membrane beta-barrel protein [Candidatus Neomarinimicrobiota bacterium]
MRYLMISLFVFSSMVFAQNEDSATSSSGWGIYGGVQSMQVSGVEDDASDEELNSFSTDRLNSFYIGVWKNTDWKIGSLPITIGAELGHRGTVSKTDLEFPDGAILDFEAEILITYLDLWASANYAMSDKFNLWIGPMLGIHLDDKIKFLGLDITESEDVDFDFDENDYGILLGAGYSLTDNMSLNFGVYRGLKDHNPGKFNNLFLDIGYSF